MGRLNPLRVESFHGPHQAHDPLFNRGFRQVGVAKDKLSMRRRSGA